MDLASLRAQQIELASSVCREDRSTKIRQRLSAGRTSVLSRGRGDAGGDGIVEISVA